MENEIKEIKNISNEIEIKISQIQEKMKRLPRSDRTRKIQIAITNLETAILWLNSATKEDVNYLNVTNRYS